MKTAAFAITLLLSGAAIAQTTTAQPDANADLSAETSTTTNMNTTADTSTSATDMNGPSPMSDTSMTNNDSASATSSTTQQHAMASNMTSPVSGQVVQPSNADPERDARGIKVMSAEAMVPAGWNGTTGTSTGGPLLDPSSGDAMASDNYPSCSATVTDNCVQAYERGRTS